MAATGVAAVVSEMPSMSENPAATMEGDTLDGGDSREPSLVVDAGAGFINLVQLCVGRRGRAQRGDGGLMAAQARVWHDGVCAEHIGADER